MSRQFFFFGTLRDADIATAVFGRKVDSGMLHPACLAEFRAVSIQEDYVPVLIPDVDGRAEGVFVQNLSDEEIRRMEFFESVNYKPQKLWVTTGGEEVEAEIWLEHNYTALLDVPWNFAEWLCEHKEFFLGITSQYMTHYAAQTVAAAEVEWDTTLAAYNARRTRLIVAD